MIPKGKFFFFFRVSGTLKHLHLVIETVGRRVVHRVPTLDWISFGHPVRTIPGYNTTRTFVFPFQKVLWSNVSGPFCPDESPEEN